MASANTVFKIVLISAAVVLASASVMSPAAAASNDALELEMEPQNRLFRYPWFPMPQLNRPGAGAANSTTAAVTCPATGLATIACTCGTVAPIVNCTVGQRCSLTAAGVGTCLPVCTTTLTTACACGPMFTLCVAPTPACDATATMCA